MLGYVVADKPELKMKEFAAYRSYYCGICKSAAGRYGQLPRMVLSYDFAFLATLLGSLEEEPEDMQMEHCLIHHIKKIPVTRNNKWIDYATDMMVLLVYYNFLDDKEDEHKLRGSLGSLAFRRHAKRLSEKYPEISKVIIESLAELSALEKEKSPSIDKAGDAFAKIMGAVFASKIVEEAFGNAACRALEHIGKNMGRWIYLADAADDIKKDIASGSYNPLIFRYEFDPAKEGPDEFIKRIGDELSENMFCCLSEVGKGLELLPIRRNKGILENITGSGMFKKTEMLLGKGENHERSV